MYSVFLKLFYYLLKVRIITLFFFLFSITAHCADDETQVASLKKLQNQISRLTTQIEYQISGNFSFISKINSKYKIL